jgi:SAM-dependent methyltransferase
MGAITEEAANHAFDREYFERLYAANPDPWQFETSPYERDKYQATLGALDHARYQSVFEIGGSIGVLTAKLAERCDRLISVDLSPSAQAQARGRCRHWDHLRFELMRVPQELPPEAFDLIVISEVGYCWTQDDLVLAGERLPERLLPYGQLLLVHYTPKIQDCALSGDAVHEHFLNLPGLVQRRGGRSERYRIDLLERPLKMPQTEK